MSCICYVGSGTAGSKHFVNGNKHIKQAQTLIYALHSYPHYLGERVSIFTSMGARCTVVIVGLHNIVVVSGALHSLRLPYQSSVIHYLSRKFKLNSNKITHTSQQDSRHHCVISIITILKTTPILN